MSAENEQACSAAEGDSPRGDASLFGRIVNRQEASAGTIWLEIIETLAASNDADFEERVYPVHPVEKTPENPQSLKREPSAAEAFASGENDILVDSSNSEPTLAVASEVEFESIKRSVSDSAQGGVRSRSPMRSRSSSRSGRRGGRSVRGKKMWISIILSAAIVFLGGWLIIRDVVLRPTPQEWKNLHAGSDSTGKTSVVEVVSQVAGSGAGPELKLVSAGESWETAAPEWSSSPLPVSGGGATHPDLVAGKSIVLPVLIDSKPVPSDAFINFAQTLKITAVVKGERVRATINGETYSEGEVLGQSAGVCLVGHEPGERVLIFEDSDRAQVNVSY